MFQIYLHLLDIHALKHVFDQHLLVLKKLPEYDLLQWSEIPEGCNKAEGCQVKMQIFFFLTITVF